MYQILAGKREPTVEGVLGNEKAAFTINACSEVQLSSFTVENYFIGQAEAMLVRGERIIIDRVSSLFIA